LSGEIEFIPEFDLSPNGFLFTLGLQRLAMPDVVDPDIAPVDLSSFVKTHAHAPALISTQAYAYAQCRPEAGTHSGLASG
jgi:2-hydroxychromene-2-carboxylate isomerase